MRFALVVAAAAALAAAHVDSGTAEAQQAMCISDLLPDADPLAKPACSGSGSIMAAAEPPRDTAAPTSSPVAASTSPPSSPLSSSSTAAATATSPPAAPITWTSITDCIRNGTEAEEYCVYHSADFAGGRGVSIVTTALRAEYLSRSSAFHLSADALAARNGYSSKVAVVPIPGKEYGVVATERIYRGERIISETASVMVDYGAFDWLAKSKIWELQGAAVDKLPHAHRSRYLNMSTHGSSLPYLEKVEKILNTNAFDVDLDDGDDDGFFVIFADIARINHDCRPSVDYIFDPKTLTQTATASRDIMPGEELSLSYIDPLRPRHQRLKQLKKQWGFSCSCASCTAQDSQAAESDARIRQIRALRREFADFHAADSAASPQLAELLVSLYEQERLTALLSEGYQYAALEYNGVGEPWTATKYARLAIEYGVALLAENDNKTADMRALAADPWGHWSWMARERKRLNWEPLSMEDDEDDDDAGDD